LLALLALFLLVLPQFLSRYALFVLYLVCLNSSLAQSWNLLGGYSGLISLGHAAFFGVGAYATALLVKYASLPFLLAAVGGGGVAAVFSALMAAPTLRLRGVYFAIGTLLLAEALRLWMINWGLTGGAQGIHFPPNRGTSLQGFYYTMLAVAAATTALTAVVLRSRLGLGLRAMRDNEDAAQNLGVNIFRTRVYAFLLSAFVTGLTGGIHAARLSTIEPYSMFSVLWSLSAINMAIIGGPGTLLGPILGAVLLTYLAELLADYHTYHPLFTGIILLLVMRFLPTGLWGGICNTRIAQRMIQRPAAS
jgi:branched-chain amino acid transport system permease protein